MISSPSCGHRCQTSWLYNCNHAAHTGVFKQLKPKHLPLSTEATDSMVLYSKYRKLHQ